MTILQATSQYLEPAATLFDAYRQFYRQPSDLTGAQDFISERLSRQDSVIYLALSATGACGFVQLYPLFSSVRMKRLWLLNDLYVHPDYRNTGVATALMQQCMTLAETTRSGGLMLQTEISNITAQPLYEKLGFIRDESSFYYYWTP